MKTQNSYKDLLNDIITNEELSVLLGKIEQEEKNVNNKNQAGFGNFNSISPWASRSATPSFSAQQNALAEKTDDSSSLTSLKSKLKSSIKNNINNQAKAKFQEAGIIPKILAYFTGGYPKISDIDIEIDFIIKFSIISNVKFKKFDNKSSINYDYSMSKLFSRVNFLNERVELKVGGKRSGPNRQNKKLSHTFLTSSTLSMPIERSSRSKTNKDEIKLAKDEPDFLASRCSSKNSKTMESSPVKILLNNRAEKCVLRDREPTNKCSYGKYLTTNFSQPSSRQTSGNSPNKKSRKTTFKTERSLHSPPFFQTNKPQKFSEDCSHCQNEGVVICEHCNGSGQMDNPENNDPSFMAGGYGAGGFGDDDNLGDNGVDGYGAGAGPDQIACEHCFGRGEKVCPGCNGRSAEGITDRDGDFIGRNEKNDRDKNSKKSKDMVSGKYSAKIHNFINNEMFLMTDIYFSPIQLKLEELISSKNVCPTLTSTKFDEEIHLSDWSTRGELKHFKNFDKLLRSKLRFLRKEIVGIISSEVIRHVGNISGHQCYRERISLTAFPVFRVSYKYDGREVKLGVVL